jgi:hypothetical protein
MYFFTEIADPQRLARVADAWPRDAAIGRLGQVCDRWIYTACLCFGLDLDEQERSGFRYGYSVYQAEYSRNLLFKSGAQMEDLFDRILDRTRSRLDIPAVRTLFGLKTRPHRNRKAGPPAQEIVIEKPRYGLSWFRISFGRLQLKAYTKGEHVLRFEATVHNAKELRCRRSLDNFDQIIDRLAGMADRFATALDCADTGFLPDGVLDELPLPAQAGASRIAGIDLNKPRIRAALAAALALAPAPGGFTVADHAARVRQITGHDGYTTRQDPPLPRPATRRPHHQRLAHPPRPCHRPHPGRSPQPPDGTQAQNLDRRRPRLRDPAHRHANPVPAHRHRDPASSRIDNILSIRECKLLEERYASPPAKSRTRAGPPSQARRMPRSQRG